jgi:hypothetical protein
MSGPPLARAIARILADDWSESSGAPINREATVRGMVLALRTRKRRRLRHLRLGGLVAAAAAAAVAVGAVGAARHRMQGPAMQATARPETVSAVIDDSVSGGVLVLSNGRTRPVFDGMPLETGDHVLALLDGHATIALATGTRLAVEGGADVAMLTRGPTQVFALAAGSVRADVAKLSPGERFVIRTTDAEVEVRGTSFRVTTGSPDRACGNGTTTRVVVYEGVVTVRAGGVQAAVHPGETWPSGCVAPSAAAEPSSAPQANTGMATARARPAAATSELAAQNDLFDEAMLAKRRGDLRAAVASFDRLLSRYPGCPFAESAEVERMKLLAASDRARAEDAAREYLHRHPHGFGRADAEALIR